MKLASVVTACVAAFGLAGQTAQASFHLMQIEQVIGGVNGDPTAQAIQLRMRSAFQNQMPFSRIRAHDAAGSNPVIIATFASAVPNFAEGARVLITSPNFANHTSPTLVTDRVMAAVIPASYLAAGSLTFEDTGGTIYWRLSWGGAGYTGSTIGSATNDLDGNFGKLTTALQSSSLQAVRFLGGATALSTSNPIDYALTPGTATFVNNAGTAFTVIGGTVPPDGDLDDSGSTDGRDIHHFVECVTSGSTSGGTCPPGDFDNSGEVTAADVPDFIAALLLGA